MAPKKLLLQHNLHPIKKWGQNFLNNEQVVKQIAHSFSCDSEDGIIEIGPGLGILTKELAKIAKKVVAIEIDKKLVAILKAELQFNNLAIVSDDFLNINLEKIIKSHFPEVKKIHIVANLPYYLTSPIIFKLLENARLFTSFTLMMQKEVAERISSLPNNKTYSNLSVICQYYSDIKIALKVNRHNFFPQPSVDSWVLNFFLKDKRDVVDEREFIIFVRKLFSKKRKTLVNNLVEITKNKQVALDILHALHWSINIRSEQITVSQFVELYHFINDSDNI